MIPQSPNSVVGSPSPSPIYGYPMHAQGSAQPYLPHRSFSTPDYSLGSRPVTVMLPSQVPGYPYHNAASPQAPQQAAARPTVTNNPQRPPLTQVTSAPQMPTSTNPSPQVQPSSTRSKRQSLANGLKKAYTATQSSPLTKMATRIAIYSIASSLTGSDVGSGFDSVDMSSGYDGGFDTSYDSGYNAGFDSGLDTGVDAGANIEAANQQAAAANLAAISSGGIDSGTVPADQTDLLTRDPTSTTMSSGDVTQMMQQQMWENVTLPQSGWSCDPSSLPIG